MVGRVWPTKRHDRCMVEGACGATVLPWALGSRLVLWIDSVIQISRYPCSDGGTVI